ncbi:MAG TPA: hypothetical protein PLG56_05080 [Lacunisphaera sp.]|nr:hypothetical protein [Lacunisphaera sp.]
MNPLHLCMLILLSTEALVAGEVSTAFRALVAGAQSVRIVAVPQEKGKKTVVVEYSAAPEISRAVGAFDFVDPKPIRTPDGRIVYLGPCRCLPTHFITFMIRDGTELVLFLDAEEPATMGVDVQKEDIQRLKMSWHTTLALTPDSTKSVTSLLKNLKKEEPNSER